MRNSGELATEVFVLTIAIGLIALCVGLII